MTEKIPKNLKTYSCGVCGIETGNKTKYNKHLMTAKHKNRTNIGVLEQSKFICKKCNKIYKARNSLWYHEKMINKCYKKLEVMRDKLIPAVILVKYRGPAPSAPA